MAQGEQPSSILGLVMTDTFAVLVGGIVAGIGLSLASVRLLQKMLFGLSPRDATTTLMAVGIPAAGWIRRRISAGLRARVDPLVAPRYE